MIALIIALRTGVLKSIIGGVGKGFRGQSRQALEDVCAWLVFPFPRDRRAF